MRRHKCHASNSVIQSGSGPFFSPFFCFRLLLFFSFFLGGGSYLLFVVVCSNFCMMVIQQKKRKKVDNWSVCP